MDGWEREEQMLSDDLASGNISQGEYNNEMRALQRDYCDAARESAQDAYDRELERW